MAPDNSAYVGYNDGRRAWSDERGDIQQSWHQKELGMRRTNGGGVAIFDGCVVGIQGDVLVEVSEGWEATPLRFAIGEGLDADQGITIKPKQ